MVIVPVDPDQALIGRILSRPRRYGNQLMRAGPAVGCGWSSTWP